VKETKGEFAKLRKGMLQWK